MFGCGLGFGLGCYVGYTRFIYLLVWFLVITIVVGWVVCYLVGGVGWCYWCFG